MPFTLKVNMSSDSGPKRFKSAVWLNFDPKWRHLWPQVTTQQTRSWPTDFMVNKRSIFYSTPRERAEVELMMTDGLGRQEQFGLWRLKQWDTFRLYQEVQEDRLVGLLIPAETNAHKSAGCDSVSMDTNREKPVQSVSGQILEFLALRSLTCSELTNIKVFVLIHIHLFQMKNSSV